MFEIQAFVLTMQMYADLRDADVQTGKMGKIQSVILFSQKDLVQERHMKETNHQKAK